MRWRREHGSKIVHPTRQAAQAHAAGLNLSRPDSEVPWHDYECRWGQWYFDGETAEVHWHVGRKGKQ